ncbi:MAG: protein kinase [Cyanobacteria bacterium HKST-UBA01]|nr:protein kinase [Cyanobacteria bacterium HKST-UBA01]
MDKSACEKCGKPRSEGKPGPRSQFGAFCACEPENPQPDEITLNLGADKFPLDRYQPLTKIARGASGTVYRAKDLVLGKIVAVKVLHSLSPEELIQFQEEARATSKLNHQNIVEILDFGATEAGTPYMVLEYFEGVSLDSYLKDSAPLSWRAASTIAKELAKALEHAHTEGILHRDIKPSNILCQKAGSADFTLKLIDFGIAKLSEKTVTHTEYQGLTLAGTPSYMSPDIARGHPYTEASEIYSLGCLLFELLTGHPPFNADTALEVIALHASQKPPALAANENALNEEEIEPVQQLLDRCLAKEPRERFQKMQEFLNALESIEFEAKPPAPTKDLSSSATPRKRFRLAKKGLTPIFIAGIAGGALYVVTANLLEQNSKPQINSQKTESSSQPKLPKEFTTLKAETAPIDTSGFKLNNEELDQTAEDFMGNTIDTTLRPSRNGVVEFTIAATDDALSKLNETGEFGQPIKTLKICGEKFTGEGFKYLEGKYISRIVLDTPALDDEGIARLKKFSSLSDLELVTAPKLTGKSGKSLGELPQLNCMELNLPGLSNEFLLGLSESKNLKHLFLRCHKEIPDTKLKALATCPNLEDISICNALVEVSTIKLLRNFKNLNVLGLVGCEFEPLAAAELSTLNLESISIDYSEMNGKEFFKLTKMKSLKTLNVLGENAVDSFYLKLFRARRPDVKLSVIAREKSKYFRNYLAH